MPKRLVKTHVSAVGMRTTRASPVNARATSASLISGALSSPSGKVTTMIGRRRSGSSSRSHKSWASFSSCNVLGTSASALPPHNSPGAVAICSTGPGTWCSMFKSGSVVLTISLKLRRGWFSIAPPMTISLVQIRPGTFSSGTSARKAHRSAVSVKIRTAVLFLPPARSSKFACSHASLGKVPPARLREDAHLRTASRATLAELAKSSPSRRVATRSISMSRTGRGMRLARGKRASAKLVVTIPFQIGLIAMARLDFRATMRIVRQNFELSSRLFQVVT